MINVTGAIIIHNDKVLITQRAKGKHSELMWEFPGGKQEQGETLEQCLIREIKEELGKDIIIKHHFLSQDFTNDIGDFCLHTFICSTDNQHIAFHNDHESYKWIFINQLSDYNFLSPDLPSIKKLQSLGAKI